MERIERAKIFAPFQALSGLEYALREKEKEIEYTKKKAVADDKIRSIDNSLKNLRCGDHISLFYYSGGKYEFFSGKIISVNARMQKLIFPEKEIFFDDIYSLRRERILKNR